MIPLDAIREMLPTLIAVAGVLLLTGMALWLSGRSVRQWADRVREEQAARREEIEEWARQLNSVLRRSIGLLALLAAAVIALRGLGVLGVKRLGWEEVEDWLRGPGLRIALIFAGAWALNRVAQLAMMRVPGLVARPDGPRTHVVEREKRAQTVSRLLSKLVTVLVMSIAGLMVLRELGVDIVPILTGAGIAGLAVGFGAQHLVRDMISGFFIILEDQIRVGDTVNINGKGGLVEAIHLRTTVIRSFDGTVHIFPNGSITEVSNLTKDYSYAVLDLSVAYKEDVDRVMQVLREVGKGLEADPEWRDRILEPLEICGVDRFTDTAVILKMRMKTLPQEQFNVGRELRRRIKNRFDALGIEMTSMPVALYFGDRRPPTAEAAEKAEPRAAERGD